jgi:hypothetical protein
LLISWSMFSFYGASGEYYRKWDLRTNNNGSLYLCSDEKLARWFVPWSKVYHVWTASSHSQSIHAFLTA